MSGCMCVCVCVRACAPVCVFMFVLSLRKGIERKKNALRLHSDTVICNVPCELYFRDNSHVKYRKKSQAFGHQENWRTYPKIWKMYFYHIEKWPKDNIANTPVRVYSDCLELFVWKLRTTTVWRKSRDFQLQKNFSTAVTNMCYCASKSEMSRAQVKPSENKQIKWVRINK